MAGNSFGQLFRITSFGESHGAGIGVVIDGCPAGLALTEAEIQTDLDRRKPGQSEFSTPRNEADRVEILSGVFEGKTTGTPIALLIRNENQISAAYGEIAEKYRPGHADFGYDARFGFRDFRGGGRSSARETAARVAAAAVAKKLLALSGIEIFGFVSAIAGIESEKFDRAEIEKNALRSADASVVKAWSEAIRNAKTEGDSVGGVVEIRATGVPAGLGEPVFHKLSADLGGALFSIPAVKGVEIGDGFAAADRKGSENNDAMRVSGDRIETETNHAGGIVGGISNGEEIVVRIALKPVSSIAKPQKTIDRWGAETMIEVHGRHDPCVCPRAVPIAEAMVALVLADHLLLAKTARI